MSQPVTFVLSMEEKFNRSNWTEWKGLIISAVKSHGVMGYLDGTIPRPATPSPSTDPTNTPLPPTPMVLGIEETKPGRMGAA